MSPALPAHAPSLIHGSRGTGDHVHMDGMAAQSNVACHVRKDVTATFEKKTCNHTDVLTCRAEIHLWILTRGLVSREK